MRSTKHSVYALHSFESNLKNGCFEHQVSSDLFQAGIDVSFLLCQQGSVWKKFRFRSYNCSLCYSSSGWNNNFDVRSILSLKILDGFHDDIIMPFFLLGQGSETVINSDIKFSVKIISERKLQLIFLDRHCLRQKFLNFKIYLAMFHTQTFLRVGDEDGVTLGRFGFNLK